MAVGRMTRIALFASLFASLSAPAALAATTPPTIKAASKGVQVGKEGVWKDAAPGMTITEADFVRIPDNASATIVLPDASVKEFQGRSVIPGRRLASDKVPAGAMVYFSQGLQKTAAAVAGEASGTRKSNGAGKATNVDQERLNKKNSLLFTGVESEIASNLRHGDAAAASGNYAEAVEIGQKILGDASAGAHDKSWAHLVVAEGLTGQASYREALTHLEGVVATKDDDTLAARGLAQRGEVYMQLGDDAKAQADLKAAIATAGDKSSIASRAKFDLGVLAVTGNDTKTARSWFDQLKDSPTLYQAGMAMLEAK